MGSYKLSRLAAVDPAVCKNQNLPRRHRGTEKFKNKPKLRQTNQQVVSNSGDCPIPDLPARIDAILTSITLLLYQQHSYTLLEHSLSSGFFQEGSLQ